ncbi:response regulator transcription factor [Roseateles sp.]|uniref:response regulator transcription factor n=1 Tax=Roseateles sp. TaxID=1971397 RepID=UPI00286A2A2C|nr:response regulator [Roseateles sp.]
MSQPQPTVYIVDDDASFLAATSRLLVASGFRAMTFESASELIAHCTANVPGCIVADLQMPGLNGLELQSALALTRNPLPILFLTGNGDIASSVRAMRGGAEDFLEKRAPKDALLDAVQRALARDARERAERERTQALKARFEKLSVREKEVLAHVLQAQLNKQIAGDLAINERTVKLHRTSIMAKLGVRSVMALTLLAQEAGMTPAEPTFPKGQ